MQDAGPIMTVGVCSYFLGKVSQLAETASQEPEKTRDAQSRQLCLHPGSHCDDAEDSRLGQRSPFLGQCYEIDTRTICHYLDNYASP